MSVLKRYILIAVALFTVANLNAQKFSFAYLSDTHIAVGAESVKELKECIADINSNKELSFAIFAGDITEFGSDAELKLAKEIIDELTIPYYIVAGNHDSKWSESGCNTFVKVFGYESFDFEKEGIRFIGTNSGPNMRMAPALVPRETMVWLDSLSHSIDPKQPLVFINHFPMDTSVLNYTQVLDVLHKMNTQLILNGHWHQDRAMVYEGIPGVIGRSSMATGKKGPGYTIVKVEGSTVTFSERLANLKKTGHPWHTLRMSNGKPFDSNIKYPRQNFDMNKEYPNIKEIWRRTDSADIGSGAVPSQKYVVYANAQGYIYALNWEDGSVVWSYKAGGKIFSTPAIYADGTSNASVIVGCTDNYVYSLSLKDGKLKWKHQFEKSVLGSPAILGNTVYIGGSDNTFRAINAKNGKLIWKNSQIKGFVECKPYVDKSQVVFGDWANTLYSLDPSNGKIQWTWVTKGSRMYSPASVWPVKAGRSIIIATPKRMSYGINAKNGVQLWEEKGGRESVGLSPDKKTYYVKTMKDMVLAYTAGMVAVTALDQPMVHSGVIKKWESNAGFGYEIAPTPITSTATGGKDGKGLVFIPTDKGNIIALNAVDGSIAWKYKISMALINYIQPIGDNKILVSTMDGFVTLIEY